MSLFAVAKATGQSHWPKDSCARAHTRIRAAQPQTAPTVRGVGLDTVSVYFSSGAALILPERSLPQCWCVLSTTLVASALCRSFGPYAFSFLPSAVLYLRAGAA